jgi:hypothetical protein
MNNMIGAVFTNNSREGTCACEPVSAGFSPGGQGLTLSLPDVTALIKTFLRDEYLFTCVLSLHLHYPNIKIFVADDGYCSDEKEARLKDTGECLDRIAGKSPHP